MCFCVDIYLYMYVLHLLRVFTQKSPNPKEQQTKKEKLKKWQSNFAQDASLRNCAHNNYIYTDVHM